ncbi:MAG: hypothetical protein K8I03_16260 [Ignavibacteria bacterium]|nr:hypothetical protein [Ignavibacteria bacterium]
MKKSTIIILLLFFAFILASCDNASTNNNPNGNNNTLPDAVFNASVSGDYSEQWNLLVTGNYLNTQTSQIINGGYTTSSNLMILTATKSAGASITINAHTGGVDTGSFSLNTSNMDIGSYNNPGIGASGFVSTGGNIRITKKEYLQTVGNDFDWFVDGTFFMTMQNQDNPPKTVAISGSFTSMHISPESAP